MKRIFCTLLTAVLMFSLCACGNSKPEDTSDAMYQIGINALRAADDYIAGNLTGEEAYEKIDEYYEQAKAQEEKDLEELKTDTLFDTIYENDSHISIYISFLSYRVMNAMYGSGAMSEVSEARNNLADQLGKD